MSSPSLSITSWSNLNEVYQANSAATLEVVNNVLNSPHNMWNYPSPGSPCLQYPSRTQSPTIPWLPTVASSPEFVISGFPFLAPTASPVYATSSANPNILLVDPDTLEPCPIDPNPYIIRFPSLPTLEPTLEALRTMAEFDLEQLVEHIATHVVHLAQAELNGLLPPLTQDNWAQLQFPGEVINHKDIPVENISPPVIKAPVATVASPAPLSLAALFTPLAANLLAFAYLFAALPCLAADNYHPHQYSVVYEQGCHIWYFQEEFINTNFLNTIARRVDLQEVQALFFVTPFCADILYSIHIHSDSTLPPVHICAKIGKHPWSPNFPFGYIKTTFLDSIKFVFSCFPPSWLSHFEGTLVPLVAYNFLDGCMAILCRHLHFTPEGILFLNCSTRIEDILYTDPSFARFTPTPHVPRKPFNFITPPPDTPL